MENMFDLKNNHQEHLKISHGKARASALDYLNRMEEAFAVLNDLEKLLTGPLPVKTNDIECMVETSDLQGRDFRLKLLFDDNHYGPVAAEIIKDD